MTAPRSALRRYPALVWLVAAGLLALLLPSGLTLPQSGPSTLAEYAPVPGASDGANLGELAATGSGGLGSGGGGTGGAGPAAEEELSGGPSSAKLIRKAGTKRCVGNPPRQTEDPLSPPCIAFFDGDNGGATAKGVTRDRVVIAIESDEGNNQRSGEIVDCLEAPAPEDTPSDLACKAYARYFNDRYQTYGRVIQLHHTHGATSTSIGAAGVDERLGPFAFGTPVLLSGSTWARRGILAVGYMGTRRAAYRDNAPMFMTYRPDFEDDMKIAASYLCQQLVGRPARYSGNPLDRDRTRLFGVWAGTSGSALRDDILAKETKEQCGAKLAVYAEGDSRDATTRMQADGVTTVIMMEGVAINTAATSTATNHGWFPEWVVIGNSSIRGIDTNPNGRLQHQAQWQNAFGITVDYRRGPTTDQHWFRAYREGCPSCPTPRSAIASSDIPFMYDLLTLLFWGIQASGPRLTVENVDKGLHAIPPRASADPFKPAAYFAPGNWTFVKDAMAIWWDPTGQPPGSQLRGCYRLPAEGRRLRAGEWPTGDEHLKAPGPCQGDPFEG